MQSYNFDLKREKKYKYPYVRKFYDPYHYNYRYYYPFLSNKGDAKDDKDIDTIFDKTLDQYDYADKVKYPKSYDFKKKELDENKKTSLSNGTIQKMIAYQPRLYHKDHHGHLYDYDPRSPKFSYYIEPKLEPPKETKVKETKYDDEGRLTNLTYYNNHKIESSEGKKHSDIVYKYLAHPYHQLHDHHYGHHHTHDHHNHTHNDDHHYGYSHYPVDNHHYGHDHYPVDDHHYGHSHYPVVSVDQHHGYNHSPTFVADMIPPTIEHFGKGDKQNKVFSTITIISLLLIVLYYCRKY